MVVRCHYLQKVKRQKQRPCIDKIFSAIQMVLHSGINKVTMIAELEAAVSRGGISKVIYQGANGDIMISHTKIQIQ